MSTTLSGLRTAIYFTDDIQAAKEWYIKVLDVQPYFDEPFYVGFNVGGYELGLHPGAGKAGKTGSDSVNTYWGVDNVQATYDKLLSLGAEPHETPNEVGGGIIVGAVKDPWGNVLGIIYNPHFNLPG